jgi:hypothetical protein
VSWLLWTLKDTCSTICLAPLHSESWEVAVLFCYFHINKFSVTLLKYVQTCYCTETLVRMFFSPSMARQPLGGLGRLIFRGFTITLYRHTTLGRTPLDEGPARRRDLYLTTHNTHKRQTSLPPVGLEPTIPVSERPQTHALDRAATGIGRMTLVSENSSDFH